jgi:hypothetical protein
VDLIDLADGDPPIRIKRASIDAVRPACCARCGAVGGRGRLVFHGHGARDRCAVLPGRHWQGPARVVTVEVRRFLCTACEGTCTVLPRGLVPRHLYALFSIAHAWWLAVPLGEGLDDPAVCARQGVDRDRTTGKESNRTGRRRWHSLRRWSAQIETWWPSVPVAGGCWRERVGSLLASLVGTAAEAGPAGVVRCAVHRSAGQGAAV